MSSLDKKPRTRDALILSGVVVGGLALIAVAVVAIYFVKKGQARTQVTTIQ